MSNIRTTGKKTSNTLVRDLVNVGIFGALYVIISFLVAFIGYIPVFIVVVCGLVGLVASIPVFVFFAKIDRPLLCCTLFCFLFGMVMFLTGHGDKDSVLSVVGLSPVDYLLKPIDKNSLLDKLETFFSK